MRRYCGARAVVTVTPSAPSLSRSLRRILAVRQPFQIEARQCESIAGEICFLAAAIETENGAVFGHCNVAVRAPSRLNCFVHRPCLPLVVAQLDGDVLAIAALASLFFTVGP